MDYKSTGSQRVGHGRATDTEHAGWTTVPQQIEASGCTGGLSALPRTNPEAPLQVCPASEASADCTVCQAAKASRDPQVGSPEATPSSGGPLGGHRGLGVVGGSESWTARP